MLEEAIFSQVKQSTVDYYLGKERLRAVEEATLKNVSQNFRAWADKRIRKYFRNMIF